MTMESMMSRLIVNDLPREITEDAFEEHFAKFGSVSHFRIARSVEAERSHVGFVRFHDPSHTTKALVEPVHVILGEEVKVDRPDYVKTKLAGLYENSPWRERKKIFVGGLPRDLTDGELREHFEQFGGLTDFVVIRDSAGQSRGFGYVTFADEEPLENVLKNVYYEIKGKRVEIKMAVPRGSHSHSPL